MLRKRDCTLIHRKGICTTHDYWFNSLIVGEPHLQKEVITYYDGRVATICGFPLNGSTFNSADCRDLAVEWVKERGAESVVFVGPRQVNLKALTGAGLRLVAEEQPFGPSAELVIDCTNEPSSVFSRRLYRRSRSLDFDLKVRDGGLVSAEHFRLIEMFYRERRLTAYLAEAAFAIPAVLRSQKVRLLEARREQKLCGFVAFHKPFHDIAIGLFMMTDSRVPGICDFLYSVMLEESQRAGALRLNVGPSPSVGHFNFKLKWGGVVAVPPYYYAQWGRGSLARRFHVSWGPRLVRLKA